MAEILVAKTVCDRHERRHGKHVDGETHKIIIDGEEIDVDWCPECHKRLVDGLLTELREYGRSVSGKPRRPQLAAVENSLPKASKQKAAVKGAKRRPSLEDRPRRYQCLWCTWKPFTSATGLMLHATGKHGIDTQSTVEVFGTTCPLCGDDTGETSVGYHANRQHDGMTLTEVFQAAQAAGDPYKVVEKVLAKGTQ